MRSHSNVADQRSEVGDRRSRVHGPETMVEEQLTEDRSQSDLSTLDHQASTALRVSLLTGGGDKPYALGMAEALTAAGIALDVIGSDDLDVPKLSRNAKVNFLNLRGDQQSNVSSMAKMVRVARYYLRLVRYAAIAKPQIFHILWNNKFQFFDRTVLMLYYKLLGKRVVFTAHNVNAGERDANDSFLNRISLRVQYVLSDHIFVHTIGMREQLTAQFGIAEAKVSVVPFGINNTVPNTELSRAQAKETLGVNATDKTLLFFGNIAPYKGLEYLITAFSSLLKRDAQYRLLIVGNPKGSKTYWEGVRDAIASSGGNDRIIQKIEYVPDEDTELYFKAADVLVLPYTRIFQSGVLFLGYSFGLPAIAADVGNLSEEIVEGRTGYTFRPGDCADLVDKTEKYFKSNLFSELETMRFNIQAYANKRYSWDTVAAITTTVYTNLLSGGRR
jgi:D-inositol-3-phosphate glycosyltransferase